MTLAQSERRSALFVVILSSFLTPFMGSALNVAMPDVGREFALDVVALSWVVTAYSLAAAVSLLPWGRIADLVGRKKVFLWGMAVYAVASLLSALSPSGATLIAARSVHGVGAAMGFATGMAIVVSVARPEEKGQALGWNVAAVYLGLSVGPFVGGLITHALGWRWIFGVSALGGVLAWGFAAAALREEWADARGQTFDVLGALFYGFALVAVMIGFSRLPHSAGSMLIVSGAVGFAAFVLWERQAASPLVELAIFTRNPVFALSNAAALINYAATAAVAFLLSLYLQYAKGLTPQGAGLVLMAQPVVMTVFSPLAGRLSDRIAAWKLASAGMAVAATGMTVFSFVHPRTSLWAVGAGLAVLGFGFALFSSPNTNAVMSSVERKHYGIASSALATMRIVGQALSMGLTMLVMAVVVGRVQVSPATLPRFVLSMRIAFRIFAVMCVAGVFASLARKDHPQADGL